MLVIVCKLYYFLNFLFYSISIAPLQVTLYSEALPTTAQTLCWSFHVEAHRAIVSEELAQGPYVARRAGFEPTTLRPQANARTHCITTPSVAIIQIRMFRLSCMIVCLLYQDQP